MCLEYRDLSIKIRHDSCDEFNCNSARLQARWMLKVQILQECHKYIQNVPYQSCSKSPKCLANPNAKRLIHPYQVVLAVVSVNKTQDEYCSKKYAFMVRNGIHNSCDLHGHKKAKDSAMRRLMSKIPDKRCKEYVKTPPMVFVQYDCF